MGASEGTELRVKGDERSGTGRPCFHPPPPTPGDWGHPGGPCGPLLVSSLATRWRHTHRPRGRGATCTWA